MEKTFEITNKLAIEGLSKILGRQVKSIFFIANEEKMEIYF